MVGPRGDLSWLCFPRWHDDAVFAALLGGRSAYALAPRGRYVWGGYYEPGGLIWRSRWATEAGIVESREALALPASPRRAIVVRRVRALDAPAEIEVRLAAGAGFDRHGMARLHRDEGGVWRAELGDERLAWHGAGEAEAREEGGGKTLALRFALEPGESRDLVLVLACADEELAVPPPRQLWAATEEAWRERVPSFDETLAPRDARHAYAVLRGLTSADGGMVAAATTSLPERAEQGRSYDYRYAWLRDQAYAGQAVAAAGPEPLLDNAVTFVAERLLADGAHTAPAYTVDGERVPPERELGLPGYPGGVDVVGNRVRDQFQLDVFGEALLLFAAAARHDRMTGDAWRAVEVAAEAIAARRHDPEAG
ncbi:MAG TPA: glycoside hydrolase family 15 protein, partial [Solirubrobacterales bacterium]|nr:glycoside hydrolase family 15 protein [Solirubrobacterales bacterium]